MKACRGSLWLGWAALLLGAVVGSARAQGDGSLRWSFTTGNTGSAYVYSSPAIGPDGTVYVGVDINTRPTAGRLLALNPDGSEKANWPRGGFVTPDYVDSSPAVGADGTIYFGCWDGKLYALNPSNGTKKWDIALGASVVSSPSIGPDGTIYIGSFDGFMHAIRPNGTQRWVFAARNAIESTPAIAPDGTIYFGSYDSTIYALNADGSLKWSVATLAPVVSSPAIDVDGTVYIGSGEGVLYALAPETGAKKWEYPTGAQILASPVIGPDRVIYVGNVESNFYAVNADGTLKWSISVGVNKAITSSAAVRSDGTIIFGASDYQVRALNPETGTIKWVYTTREKVESSPVIAPDGTVYVGSMDGRLYSFNGSGAPASTISRWPMFRRDVAHSGAVPAVPDGGRLINLATRAQAGNGTPLIAGLATTGTGTKNYLIRGIGPTLEQLGVTSPLSDPTLAVRSLGSETVLFASDNWGSERDATAVMAAATAVGAFPLPVDSRDAAVLGPLPGGLYTASLGGSGGETGVALIEAYDTAPNAAGARLVNLSTRAHVGTGDRILIPGLVIGGSAPVRVLVRAVGPGLTGFGVTEALARPTMRVFGGAAQTPLLTNTGWTTSRFRADIAGAAAIVGAFPLAEGSADCAELLMLSSGSYTIQVSGVGGTTGEALVEVYLLP